MIAARYEYWMTAALFLIGLYGVTMKRNLVMKLIGLNLMQSATILFVVALGVKWNGVLPIVPAHGEAVPPGTVYTAALPHVLMLTAIVVSVSVTGVAIALLILLYRSYGTLDERKLPGGGG